MRNMKSTIVLAASGPRAVVSDDEATDISQHFTKLLSDTECNILDLSCRAWRLECLQTLPLLRISKTVRTLKLDDIIASLPTEAGLASLQYLAEIFHDAPNLICLHLDDNAVGTRGVAVLRPLLAKKQLRTITMNNCGLAEADGATLCEILCSVRLQTLSLGRNQMGPGGALHIEQLLSQWKVDEELKCRSNLRSFSYAGCRPLEEGTLALARGLALANHNNLLHLDLNDCHFTHPDAIPLLCQCLEHAPQLQHLNLRDGELQVDGLRQVLKSLRISQASLQVLELGAVGELSEEGAALLREYLTDHGDNLQLLTLDTNELGDEGVVEIAAGVAHCTALHTLNLECNEIGLKGCRALLNNRVPKLQKLILTDNLDISAKLAVELQQFYPKVLVDEDVLDEENMDGDDDVDALGAIFTQTKI